VKTCSTPADHGLELTNFLANLLVAATVQHANMMINVRHHTMQQPNNLSAFTRSWNAQLLSKHQLSDCSQSMNAALAKAEESIAATTNLLRCML
jgi:hypothetical protein